MGSFDCRPSVAAAVDESLLASDALRDLQTLIMRLDSLRGLVRMSMDELGDVCRQIIPPLSATRTITRRSVTSKDNAYNPLGL